MQQFQIAERQLKENKEDYHDEFEWEGLAEAEEEDPESMR